MEARYGAFARTGNVEGADKTVGTGEEVCSIGRKEGGVWGYEGFRGGRNERVGCEEGRVEG